MPSAAAPGSEADQHAQCCTCAEPPMPASSKMKRHSAPTSPPPLPPRLLASPTHPSRPPHDDESDATSLTSWTSGGSDGDKKVKAAQSFEALYNNEKLSDFLLDVNQGMYVFHAHKMIVGLKSERLAALITTATASTAATTTTSSSGGSVSASNTSSSLSTSVHNYIPNSNTTTFTAGNSHPAEKGKQSPQQPESPGARPTLYLQETPECGAVFGRFLYFIYSGAVWLHRDYVLPLHALSVKYGVAALAAHCEGYVQQLLHKCLQALHEFNAAASSASASVPSTQTGGGSGSGGGAKSTTTTTATAPQPPALGTLLSVTAVCDVYESAWDMFGDGTRRDAFDVLTRRFAELCHADRWANCCWTTVRDLLRSDACACDENVMLVAATDWMKRSRLQDKARIQELLSSIRYPRLPRRVLYHLHTTASFRNFPPVQALIEAAIRYHCFRDVPEARDEFTGRQYKARGGARPACRHAHAGGDHASCSRDQGQGCDPEAGDMSGSNTSSSGGFAATPSNANSNSNEWGCYGDPLELSPSFLPAGDRCTTNAGDNNNNVEEQPQRQHHRRAGIPTSRSRTSPDLAAQPSDHSLSTANTNNNSGNSRNNNNHANGQRSHKNHHNNRRPHREHHNHHGCRAQQTARNNRHLNQQHHHHQQKQQQHQIPQQHQQHNPHQNHHHHHQIQLQQQDQLQNHQQHQHQQYLHHQHQQLQQQHHPPEHPHQCRGCYEGRGRHQGSPVATVQPRVLTPPPLTAVSSSDSPRQAVSHVTSGVMTSSGHGELVRHVDAMNSTSDLLAIQPPPFTRV